MGSKYIVAMLYDGQFVVAGNIKGNQIYLLNHRGKLLRQYSAMRQLEMLLFPVMVN